MNILCFGSLNLDKVYRVHHFVQPGETVSGLSLEEHCGGKGLNQSVAMAKAGGRVWHAGCVGRSDGQPLLQTLENSGVDISLVRRLDHPTGHAIIQVEESGQNCILLYGGANQQITTEQIDETLAQFQAGDLLVLQNEINNLPYLMEAASRKGLTIVLNPSPMDASILALPLEHVSYFLLNEVEARELCGEDRAVEEYPQLLLERFPHSRIVLTLGAKGCIYQDACRRVEQPACKVKAVDTTAAGDTFTGYFLAAVAQDIPIEEALKTATKAAAISVSRHGASPSIPTKEEVEAFSPDAQEN